MSKNMLDLEAKKSKIISSIQETLEGSSVHSLPNIVRNEYKSIKIVWLILFLVSSGGCAYICYKNVMGYLEFDVVTKIEIKSLNVVNFPMIRICDLSIFRTAYAKYKVNEIFNSYNLSLDLFESPHFNNQTNQKKFNSFSNQSDFFIRYRTGQYLAGSNLGGQNYSEKRRLGNELNDFLITCIYGLQPCDITYDFINHYDFVYGSCFLFNSGKNSNESIIDIKRSAQTGWFNGLNLELFIGSVEANNLPFSSFNGLNIYVTNQNILNTFIDGISIIPGFSTSIIIQRTKIIKQPYPYSECTADLTKPDSYNSDIYKQLMNTSSHYDLKSCQLMCYQKNLGNRCNCQDTGTRPFYPHLPFCIKTDLYFCNINYFQEFLLTNSFSNCDCPIECQSIAFSYSISLSEYPTSSYAKSLLNNPEVLIKFNKTNVTFKDLRKSLASVSIFYNDISEQIVSQEPKMDLLDLIANIGGILGLFLGMSLLSFAEFIEIIMESLFIWFDFNTS